MRRALVALTATAAVWAAVPAMAVTFDFSFTNVNNGGGTVAGVVSNLVDNSTSAGDVAVTANSAGYGLGSYNGNDGNAFTMSNGVITVFNYVSFGDGNTDPATGCCSLALTSANGAGISDDSSEVAYSASALVSFTPVTTPPAPIPLPAPFGLLAAGLGLLAWVGRARGPAPDRRYMKA
jgi:hypothetical protein